MQTEDRAGAGGTTTRVASATVEIIDGNGEIVARGIFQRAYLPNENQLTMIAAFLRDPMAPQNIGSLPSWIKVGIPLDAAKGTPTVTAFTLYQMRAMGIPYGSLTQVKLGGIQNINTELHLHWLKANYPNKTWGELVENTHSVRYAETILSQSGHKIIPGSFSVENIKYGSIGWFRNEYGSSANYGELERYYNLQSSPPNTQIPIGFDIYFGVERVP